MLYGHTAARSPSPSHPALRRRQTLARGPSWQLCDSEGGSWTIRVERDAADPLATWSDILQAVRNIAELTELRPLLLDLRGAPRLAGAAAKLAASLFAEFERRSLRICAVVGSDLVHAVRLHRVFGFSAPLHGRCFLTEDEGLDWVARGAWPIVPPSPVVARPWTRSRPYLSVAQPAARR
ncbi:MAG: hypothetical protein R6X02_10780 [Enhygromyxa sp.]